MWSLNFKKLVPLLGASLLCINSVKAEIPVCTKVSESNYSISINGYVYCIYNGKISNYAEASEVPTAYEDVAKLDSGFQFITSKNYQILKDQSPKDPTEAHLIDLKVEGNSYTFTELEITEGYYIQADGSLVYCDNNRKCVVEPTTSKATYYFIDYKGDLIRSDGDLVTIEKSNGYYINGNTKSNPSKQLIKCDPTCTEVAAQDGDAYIDVTVEGGVITCKEEGDDGNKAVKCTYETPNGGYYINKSKIDSTDKPLIDCESKETCTTDEVTIPEPYSYYENALDKSKIISCSSTKNSCKLEQGNANEYYVQIKGEDKNKLMKCSDGGEQVTCEIVDTPQEGYYLNAGGDSSSNQVIFCDDNKKCTTKHVSPGYFINNGKDEDEETPDDLIQCDFNICKTVVSSIKCDGIKPTSATVCFDGTMFQFYKSDDLSNPLNDTTNGDLYIYDTLKKFPTITNSETITLYRLSGNGVERYIGSGVVGVNSISNQKAADLDSSDVIIYDCSSTTKLCYKRTSCISNTYAYDIENKAALFCNGGKLEAVTAKGYYLDSAAMVGSKNPYIIKCDDSECVHEAPTVSSYYINANTSSSNKLIYCHNSNCYTIAASSGYYVFNQQNGIISCTSSTSCTEKDATTIGGNAHFVNAGVDKRTNSLIFCNEKTCVPKAARIGYYFSSNVSKLIYCESGNTCAEINPTENYYYSADTAESKNYIIKCSKVSASIICSKELADTGSYLTSKTNVLISCTKNGSCKQIAAKPGYYQSAVKITINSKRDVSNVDENETVSDIAGRDSTTTYNIIECTTSNCELLSADELSAIPVCEYNSDKCYITNKYAMGKSAVTSITAGNLCTNADRSKFYFATDTIVVAPSVIAGQTATYIYTTTTTNCIIADSKYKNYYYTVGSDIYRIDDGTISRYVESGYHFLNVDKNTLVSENTIENYNNESVKLYKCNGVSCKIMDEPKDTTYFADVNKRIIKYNVNNDAYNFAYEKDIICIFANNKCTPNADLNSREFCITYKGEIALAAADIKNRETGDCYKAGSINNNIYGFSQYLYRMDVSSATLVDKNGYHIVSLSSNNTVATKDYKNRVINTNSIKIYGCYNTNCKVYDPEDGVYYYDEEGKALLKNENDVWTVPEVSGYALVSINPNEKFVYKFKKDMDEITLLSKASTGYYYTIDNEMYECSEIDNTCEKIDESDYYFTNTGEIYYCVYDSENLEKTECTKQSCYAGQNYYIGGNYYRCEAGSYLSPIKSRNCKYDENVIINFPTILYEEFPGHIKQAMSNVVKNNNSTAVAVRSNKKYISVVPAIYTNCTYNVEETEATYEFVCLNNFVSVNKEDDTIEICSIENLGYVECVDDDSNPEKCNPSGAFSRIVLNVFSVIFTALVSLYVVLY
jgi:hypothetical protein